MRKIRKIGQHTNTPIPIDLIVREGQVRTLVSGLWTWSVLESKKWDPGTPGLILRADYRSDEQTADDEVDMLMSDGTIELIRVKHIVKTGDIKWQE